MAKRKRSPLEDIVDVVSLMPWWVGLTLALTSYLFLHHIAGMDTPQVTDGHDLNKFAVLHFFKGLAMPGQVILPFVFALGGIISLFKARTRKNLFAMAVNDQASLESHAGPKANPISTMSWQQFEMLISEFFRRQGYSIKETTGGADGGVDLRLQRADKKYIVQCKHWKTYKIGVQIIREQYGIMAAEDADGAFIVTSGVFTKDALAFATGKSITLIDGIKLKEIITQVAATNQTTQKLAGQKDEPDSVSAPTCPRCSSTLVKRVAKRGKNTGKKFWGCPRYPKCRATISI